MNAAGALALAFALSAAVLGQQRPLFRGGVELVEVDAVATDERGIVVTGLTRDDFTVREDGQPVPITTFAAVDADQARRDADGRFVVLLLDNLLTPPEMTTPLKTIARGFVDRMGGHDVAGVAMLNGSASKTTTSRADIAAAIETFRYEASKIIPSEVVRKHALDMVRGLSQQLAPLRHRRKLLVCIGAAAAFTPTEPVGRAASTYSAEWTDALAEASRSNVAVYLIDPSGLTGRRPESAMTFTETTGGLAFATNEFSRAVNRV
jgi:VWFA-related protein